MKVKKWQANKKEKNGMRGATQTNSWRMCGAVKKEWNLFIHTSRLFPQTISTFFL